VNIKFLAALACVVVGLLVAALEGKFLFGPLEWFVLSIAVSVLPGSFRK
jgi:hypothetical protein